MISGYSNAQEDFEAQQLLDSADPDSYTYKMGNAELVDFEFNPKQYYWLFNPQMQFNKRRGFNVEDEITVPDFLKMKDINRRTLTHFF